MRRAQTFTWGGLVVGLSAAILVAFIGIPVGALIARGFIEGDVLAALRSRSPPPRSGCRWRLGHRRARGRGAGNAGRLSARAPVFPGRSIVDTLIDLPVVLPPVVGGLALLVRWDATA